MTTLQDDVVITGADTYGRADGLGDNAAIGARMPLLEVSAEQWDRALAVNLTEPLLATQAIVPIASLSGQSAHGGSRLLVGPFPADGEDA